VIFDLSTTKKTRLKAGLFVLRGSCPSAVYLPRRVERTAESASPGPETEIETLGAIEAEVVAVAAEDEIRSAGTGQACSGMRGEPAVEAGPALSPVG
jgi:hypothetical protein